MKNNNADSHYWGPARITELYSRENGNETCPVPRFVRMGNGSAVIVTACAAAPEPAPDALLQALQDNCTLRIVFTPEGASLEPIERGNHHD